MTWSATSRSLLAVTLIGCQIFVAGFAWSQEQPRSRNEAPWSVQVARNKYYTGLDAARAEAIRKIEAEGLTLSYNTDGTVVPNTALDKATQHYNEQRQKLLNEVKGDQRRDVELDSLRNSAKVSVPRDTGTGIEHPDYSGALSDRDVTLGSKAEVERMKVAAQERGYHCVQGPGYIKIMELDTVLWDPSTFGPGATILRHDDPEVVLGYEKPSVVQQIKKIEQDVRQEIPTSTQEQHELVSNLAKAATKSAKAVDPDHTGLVMSDAERHRFEQLKSRRLTQDDLISTFDRPEAKERKLRDLKREAVDNLQKCDPLQREQRTEAADTLRNRRAELATAVLKENDPLKLATLRERISDLDEGLKSIKKAEDLDNATQRAITRKNPKLAETLNWTEKKTDRTNPVRPGELTRNARLLNEAQQVVAAPVEDSSSRARDVWGTATEVNKTVSKVLGSPLLRVFAQVAGIPKTYVEAPIRSPGRRRNSTKFCSIP
jgi:hypothetical protein